jgi:hypothetical protein
MRTTIIKTLASLTAFAVLTGCSSISGVVRDKPTGSPISSALVSINNIHTTTNAVGGYTITGPFTVRDVIFVNAPGYNIYTESVGTNLIHDIELTPK